MLPCNEQSAGQPGVNSARNRIWAAVALFRAPQSRLVPKRELWYYYCVQPAAATFLFLSKLRLFHPSGRTQTQTFAATCIKLTFVSLRHPNSERSIWGATSLFQLWYSCCSSLFYFILFYCVSVYECECECTVPELGLTWVVLFFLFLSFLLSETFFFPCSEGSSIFRNMARNIRLFVW